MNYLILTVAMMWFPQPIETDLCQLQVVLCEKEQPEYIQEYIRDEFNKAGLDGNRAVKIVKLESNFKPYAIGKNKNGSRDYGYFQWNNKYWQGIIDECFGSDTQLSCEVSRAIQKVKADGSFDAWTTNRLIK